ncbi:alpha/beta hydrolase [Microbacterium azadirachtae]|uniref:alpha/beta hydrolase n=1 Tax=Microbacterium azadirachtae TaxID=582680 RepID=UPI0008845E44|nr:alpha/beta hydrolase-fold protein [Microbacterium azadirachtae]SDL86181.1 Putative esterase [Microbacterium azadirachtae]SEG20942.1 Putative esterase [Microbacterium azadirachtae]SEG23255.1 Putative esterase [Microbacterium azadirachtae]
MPRWLLELNLVDGPVPWVVWGIAAAGVIALVIRPLRRRWAVRALIALVIGGVLGWAIVAVSDATNAFELPLPPAVKWWTIGGFAAIGLAIVSLWDSRWWRKVVAILTIIGAVLSMGIGINQAFGLDRTLGDILGVNTLGALDHFAPPLKPGEDPPASLAAVWKAPADMPARGRYGALSGDNAPRSTAGFTPRNATIYLPPAALVKDPPALPVVVFMMGLPGYPNPHPMVDVMNEFAAKHDGLAPIVIIADQLGAQNQNPGCIDSAAYGGVETYFNTDIPNWIRGHLRVLQDPKYWTISGYSNGGACAFIYGARHPDIWGNIATASGEPWAGFGDPKSVEKVFRGDKAAFDANKPQAILAEHPGAYDGHYAIFAAGALDKKYGPANRASADLAEAAGFTTTFYLVPNATHTGPGLRGGLEKAFDVLYPRLGLAR